MVPDELIPRCPHCGAEMFPWVRGYGNFLQQWVRKRKKATEADDLDTLWVARD